MGEEAKQLSEMSQLRIEEVATGFKVKLFIRLFYFVFDTHASSNH